MPKNTPIAYHEHLMMNRCAINNLTRVLRYACFEVDNNSWAVTPVAGDTFELATICPIEGAEIVATVNNGAVKNVKVNGSAIQYESIKMAMEVGQGFSYL